MGDHPPPAGEPPPPGPPDDDDDEDDCRARWLFLFVITAFAAVGLGFALGGVLDWFAGR